MNLTELLLHIRHQEGAESAKTFHFELTQRGLECNYPTYKKIENGQLLPSPSLIQQLATALPPKWREELIMAYSRTQFPAYSYLFKGERSQPSRLPPKERKASATPETARELNRRQISVLARSVPNYHLFLMLSMARRPLSRKELEKKFRKDLDRALEDLFNGDFLLPIDENISLRTTEWRFPSAQDDSALQKTYRQFDEWDLQLGDHFGFETLMQKMLIRRISPRYLALIQKQLEIGLDLVRSSDELDLRFNDSLVQVRVQLKSGSFPG